MSLIVDASALYAQADANDPWHPRVTSSLLSNPGPLITSQLAVAEADYFVLTLDERHFRVVTPLQGGAFSILPADSH